jgi:hypothetical protein
MVNASVEAKFLDCISAFILASSYAHHMTSFEFCDLSDDGSNRASGCCDHYRFPSYRLTNLQQSHIGCEPWHSEYA